VSQLKTVERGAEFLDEHVPGWEKLVDLNTLDLSDGCKCVVGQVVRPRRKGNFFDKLRRLGIPNEGHKLGFMGGHATFPRLTEAWVVEILRRRRGA
jgi:hypothetical protein